MTGQKAIEWCRERGVFFELEGDDLVVVGAEYLSEKAIARLREIKSEIIETLFGSAGHVPPRVRIEAEAIPVIFQENAPVPSEARPGKFLELRNVVTGVTTTIDLYAKQQRSRVERSQPRREEKIINAERVNKDEANPPVDYKLLQDVADVRNQLAEQEHETDRFCRCGNLAQTEWRFEGNLVWMCDECF